MEINRFFSICLAIISARLFAKSKPLFLSWQITQRCNLRCRYCDYWGGDKDEELSTEEIKRIVSELAVLGTKAISFTGGEPLLRDDIGEIITYAKSKGIISKINTNGWLVPQRIKEIKDLVQASLSFDGPESIHDQVKGIGSYQALVKAKDILKANNKKVVFNVTLTNYNIGFINFILDKCKEWNVEAFFQPATRLTFLNKDINPCSPDQNSYYEAIVALIQEKRSGNKYIANSIVGLEYLSSWPMPRHIYCSAGRVTFRMDSQGQLYICGRLMQAERISCRENGVREALANMKSLSCSECWCGPLAELNLALGLNFNAITNMFTMTFRKN